MLLCLCASYVLAIGFLFLPGSSCSLFLLASGGFLCGLWPFSLLGPLCPLPAFRLSPAGLLLSRFVCTVPLSSGLVSPALFWAFYLPCLAPPCARAIGMAFLFLFLGSHVFSLSCVSRSFHSSHVSGVTDLPSPSYHLPVCEGPH